jgi:hypothetical protein
MTAIPNDAVKDLRECFGRTLASRLPPHIGRLGWDAQQLAELPVMTKQQMMAGFDDLLTERRVTRARAEQQLAACAHDPGLLDGRYVCLASGGSSGVRGLFVQTAEEYVEFIASLLRPAMARVFAAGGPPAGGLPVTIVAAASPVHSSGFAAAVARGYPAQMTAVPATLPTAEIVRRLNDAPPQVLLAHTSTLALLAGEQWAGRLRISPQAITAMSELLTDENRSAIRDAFGPAGLQPPVGRMLRYAFRPAGDGGRRQQGRLHRRDDGHPRRTVSRHTRNAPFHRRTSHPRPDLRRDRPHH